MLLLDQVSEVAKKLPDERDRLLRQINASTWKQPSHKNLAYEIVSLVNVWHLDVYQTYVYMPEITTPVRYSDYSLEDGNTSGMDNLIETVCQEINEISPVLQFSLAGHEPISDATISIKIRSRF